MEDSNIDGLVHQKTLDLAAYELGNVVWKHTLRESISFDEGKKVMQVIADCLSLMDVLSMGINQNVYHLATENSVTYYDASFLHAALSEEEPLVSQDQELSKVARSMNIPVYEVNAIS